MPITSTNSGPLRVASGSPPNPAAACRGPSGGLVPLSDSAPESTRGELFLHHSRSSLPSDPHSDRNLSSLPQTQHLCQSAPSFLPQKPLRILVSGLSGLLCSSCLALCRPLAPGALGWEEIFLVVRGLLKPQSPIPAGLLQRMKTCSVGDSPSGRPALTASLEDALSSLTVSPVAQPCHLPACGPSGAPGAREAGAQAVLLCGARTPGSPPRP